MSEYTDRDTVVKKLNKEIAAIRIGGKFVVLIEDYIPGKGKTVDFMRLSDVKNLYANKRVNIKIGDDTQKVNPVDIWMKHPDRRDYKGVVFKPGIATPDDYNLYQGFAVDSVEGDTKIFHDHVRKIICAGDETLYTYVMDWLADLVQNPGGDRPGTAIVMRGKQGVGKDAFVAPFEKIIGQHYKHITGQEQLTGRFNDHLKDSLLVFINEGFWTSDKRSEGRLKSLITDDLFLLEGKFKDAFYISNHMRLIFASNNNWVVPAGLEERRMCVLDVSDDRRNDSSYFGPYYKWVNGAGPSVLLYELQNREIKSYLRTIPRTKALFDQIIYSLNSVGKFWYSRLYEGTIGKNGSWPEYLRTREVYQQYKEFCSDIKNHIPVPDNQFTKQLIDLAPGIRRKRKSYDRKPYPSLILPNLDVCRESFEEKVDIPIDWEDERSHPDVKQLTRV